MTAEDVSLARSIDLLPTPPGSPLWGHVGAWMNDPLSLIERGAELGPLFRIRLWRRALLGYTPEWNRLVLGDLDAFRSRGSLSQLSPYLSAGVVAMDGPGHRHRRAELNPAFHRREVTAAHAGRFTEIVERSLPSGPFDAGAWASGVVRRMLTAAFVGPSFPETVMRSFLAPLDRAMPAPLLRRPIRIRRMHRALEEQWRHPAPGTLGELFAGLDDGAVEARVAIAAAYDTTAHTLAFALWELAARPELNDLDRTAHVVSETLRLYPSGWIGSRLTTRPLDHDNYHVPAGTLVLYSPYLTRRPGSPGRTTTIRRWPPGSPRR